MLSAFVRGRGRPSDEKKDNHDQENMQASNPGRLTLDEVFHVATILRAHKLNDTVFGELSEAGVKEIHSCAKDHVRLAALMRRLQEKHNIPHDDVVSGNPGPWWGKLGRKKHVAAKVNVPRVRVARSRVRVEPRKILLLGASQGGKSTIFRYIRAHYGESPDAGNSRIVHSNAVGFMQGLVRLSTDPVLVRDYPACKMSDECGDVADFINSQKLYDDVDLAADERIVDALRTLWADDGIRHCFEYHRNASDEPGLDSARYFFDKLDVISEKEYVPSFEDSLRLRLRTTGFVEAYIDFEGRELQLIDVGSTRNERPKWIHVLDDFSAIIYVASLSEYDEIILEDASTNRMTESLGLFETLVNSPFCVDKPVVLLLTKEELFKAKIKRVPLTVRFPDYDGPSGDYKSALEFIQREFLARDRRGHELICVHVVDILDSTRARKTIFKLLRNFR